MLASCWQALGWTVQKHGDYAVTARDGGGSAGRPVLLVCAHMDSPGYAVDRLKLPAASRPGVVRFGVTELGSPEFAGTTAKALLKTCRGRIEGVLHAGVAGEDGERDIVFECGADDALRAEARHGDRVCFAPAVLSKGTLLEGSFLDNRLGCWMLLHLAEAVRAWRTRYEIVFGATASEELCGFGATVLAAQVRPDAVVVLDTTYEAECQGVRLGGGPVLTLSDAAVLLSPAVRDRVAGLMAGAGLPLQTEVYNFSGTDARAFPRLGLPCPVLPLLIATRGNHEPVETADSRDLEVWPEAIRVLAEEF